MVCAIVDKEYEIHWQTEQIFSSSAIGKIQKWWQVGAKFIISFIKQVFGNRPIVYFSKPNYITFDHIALISTILFIRYQEVVSIQGTKHFPRTMMSKLRILNAIRRWVGFMRRVGLASSCSTKQVHFCWCIWRQPIVTSENFNIPIL